MQLVCKQPLTRANSVKVAVPEGEFCVRLPGEDRAALSLALIEDTLSAMPGGSNVRVNLKQEVSRTLSVEVLEDHEGLQDEHTVAVPASKAVSGDAGVFGNKHHPVLAQITHRRTAHGHDEVQVLVGRRLAVGGFAEVFLGKYEGTVVAIKRLLTGDADTIQRFVSMAYLHTRSPPILHLDLKSPNILVDDRWRVKITDFGLSRARQHTFISNRAAKGTVEVQGLGGGFCDAC
eukprot:gene5078-5319_t